MDLKRGIDKAVGVVVDSLKKQSQIVGTDFAKIEQVATISANNNGTIGKLIAKAMGKVNKEGVITVEEAKGTETHVDVVEGMQFDLSLIHISSARPDSLPRSRMRFTSSSSGTSM